jgi:alkaline phosphatase D
MKALRLKRGEYRYIESQPVKPATSSIELADFSEDLSYLRNWSAGDERAATDMIAALHSGN